MEQRRREDKLILRKMAGRVKRVWIDIVVLAVMFSLTYLLPSNAEQAAGAGPRLNLLALFITKTNSVLWGWLIVDIVRKWKWPYMDLQSLIEGNRWHGVIFLLGIYIVVIYSFAVGG